jgi:hypothetical protein
MLKYMRTSQHLGEQRGTFHGRSLQHSHGTVHSRHKDEALLLHEHRRHRKIVAMVAMVVVVVRIALCCQFFPVLLDDGMDERWKHGIESPLVQRRLECREEPLPATVGQLLDQKWLLLLVVLLLVR